MDVVDTDDNVEKWLQHGGNMTRIRHDQNNIEVISKRKRVYKTLNACGLRLEVKFGQINDINEWIRLCIEELLIIMQTELNIQQQDRVGIIFNNTNNARADFSISFRPFSQYSAESILFEIEKIIQSNMLFFTDDNLIVNIDHVRVPIGYGRSHIGKSSERYYKLHKRSIFSPNLQTEDYGLCLAASITVAIAHVTGDAKKYHYLTYAGHYSILIQEARSLCTDANVNLENGGGIDEIIKFQQYLGGEYRIVVYASRDGKVIFFKSCHSTYKYTINLLFDEAHFSFVLSPTAAFSTAYFCGYCCVGYTTRLGHARCRVKCNKCCQSPPCTNDARVKCNTCKREFFNAACLQNHVFHGICQKFKMCEECYVTYVVKKIANTFVG